MKHLLAALAFTLSAGAQAVIINFDDTQIFQAGNTTYIEDGFIFTIEDSRSANHLNGGLFLDALNTLTLEHENNLAFDLVGFDVAGDAFNLSSFTFESDDISFTNAGGTLEGSAETPLIENVTSLVISANQGNFPNIATLDNIQLQLTSLDNILLNEVTPVPLPASLPFLAAGFGLFAWTKRKLAKKK